MNKSTQLHTNVDLKDNECSSEKFAIVEYIEPPAERMPELFELSLDTDGLAREGKI